MAEDSAARIEELEEKLLREPHSRAFLQLGEAYRQTGEFEKAVQVLEQGLSERSEDISARVALGRTFYEMGKLGEARRELELVIRSMPDNLFANQLLGDIYLKEGRREEAIARFEIVMTLNPLNEDVQEALEALRAGEWPTPPSPRETPPPGDEGHTASDQAERGPDSSMEESPPETKDRRRKADQTGSDMDLSQGKQGREKNGRFSRRKIETLNHWLKTIKG